MACARAGRDLLDVALTITPGVRQEYRREGRRADEIGVAGVAHGRMEDVVIGWLLAIERQRVDLDVPDRG